VGPRRAGKSALLRALRERLPGDRRDGEASPALGEPLLDWLPLDLGPVGSWRVRLDLYAVGGTPNYDATRRLLLADADGVLVVLDSQALRLDDNAQVLRGLAEMLTEADATRGELPQVFCYTKQDLPEELVLEPAALDRALNPTGIPSVGADLLRGRGAVDALHALVRLVLRRHAPSQGEG
jgi:signal recognition particle receptor subunit beta